MLMTKPLLLPPGCVFVLISALVFFSLTSFPFLFPRAFPPYSFENPTHCLVYSSCSLCSRSEGRVVVEKRGVALGFFMDPISVRLQGLCGWEGGEGLEEFSSNQLPSLPPLRAVVKKGFTRELTPAWRGDRVWVEGGWLWEGRSSKERLKKRVVKKGFTRGTKLCHHREVIRVSCRTEFVTPLSCHSPASDRSCHVTYFFPGRGGNRNRVLWLCKSAQDALLPDGLFVEKPQ